MCENDLYLAFFAHEKPERRPEGRRLIPGETNESGNQGPRAGPPNPTGQAEAGSGLRARSIRIPSPANETSAALRNAPE